MKRRGGRGKGHRPNHRPGRSGGKRRRQPNLYYRLKRFVRRNPLVSAVGSIIISIILFRASFSNNLFGANVTEFRLWFMFFAFVIGLIGLMAVWVWLRNNVSMFTTKHTVNWKKR